MLLACETNEEPSAHNVESARVYGALRSLRVCPPSLLRRACHETGCNSRPRAPPLPSPSSSSNGCLTTKKIPKSPARHRRRAQTSRLRRSLPLTRILPALPSLANLAGDIYKIACLKKKQREKNFFLHKIHKFPNRRAKCCNKYLSIMIRGEVF